MTQTTIIAMIVIVVLVYSVSFLPPFTNAQKQNQVMNEPENVNMTSSDEVIQERTNFTSDNQTTLAVTSNNNTSANGTNAEILVNASQQPQAPLPTLRGLLSAPSQSQQQQLQPSTLQQQLPPPLPSPLNVISSSPQQQSPLSLMQPTQQLPPPIGGPIQQLGRLLGFEQPSTMIAPPSTPLYPVSSFPYAGFNYQPPAILSQYSYVNDIGSMHIVGEVLNQAPVPARFVKIIATFYNAYGQVIGTDFTYANPSELAPGQRAPFDIIAPEGSVPMYQMSGYGLTVDSQQP